MIRTAAAKDADLERRRTLYQLTGQAITRADDARPVASGYDHIDPSDAVGYEALIRSIVRDPADFLEGAPAREERAFLADMAESDSAFAAEQTPDDYIREEIARIQRLPRTDRTTH